MHSVNLRLWGLEDEAFRLVDRIQCDTHHPGGRMKVRGTLLSCALIACVARPAVAQTDNDVAAWFAISLTPVGAFPALQLAPGGSAAHRLPAWAFRGSSWKFDGANDRNNSFGGSYVAPVGVKSSFTGTVGYFKPGGAGNDGTGLLGGELQSPFWESVGTSSNSMTFNASGRGSLGVGRYTGSGGGTALSLVGSLPLGLRYAMASKSVLTANLTPGFGWGRISGSGAPSQSGT